jgi:hypothetical protein
MRSLSARRAHRRGSALTVTVLLTAVVATIAFVAFRGLVDTAKVSGDRAALTDAAANAQAAIAGVRGQLAADPESYLRTVFTTERPRQCANLNGSPATIPAGAPWPAACGLSWTYAAGSATTTEVLISPPSTATADLVVVALGRAGEVTVGMQATFRRGTSGVALLSSGTLDPAQLVTGSGTLSLSGLVYGADGVVIPSGTLDRVTFATDGTFTGPVSGTNRFAAPTAGAGVLDVRTVVAAPLTSSVIGRHLATLGELGCAGTSVMVDGDQSQLCLVPGTTVRSSSGAAVTVPVDAAAFLILPGATTAGTVDVYYRTTAVATAGNCTTSCDLQAISASLSAAGTHPVSLASWTRLSVGGTPVSLAWPASGLVVTGTDAVVGLCGANFATACTAYGSATPGLTLTRSLTVLAGTPGNPRDVWVGSPLYSAPGAHLTVIGSNRVLVPFWAVARTATLTVDASLYAGSGTIAAFPGVADVNWTNSWALNGPLVGAGLAMTAPWQANRALAAADATGGVWFSPLPWQQLAQVRLPVDRLP